MVRMLLGSFLVIGLVVNCAAAADKDTKAAKNQKKSDATITKVDAKAGTVTVRMKDSTGKDVEKTFKLAEDVRYFDSTGKAAVMDLFTSGNEVLLIEEEGQLKELHQQANVGSHDGTVVKAGEGHLTMEAQDKKDYTHMVAKDAKITCDGKDCKLDDLKKGTKVAVTLDGKGDTAKVTKIEATTK